MKRLVLTAIIVPALAFGVASCDTGDQPTLHQQAKKVERCAHIAANNPKADMADCLAK